MYTLFVVLMCLVAILTIVIVLMQESKGGGLSSSFSSYNQIAGVRKTTDFVEKATWTLAILLLCLSIACAYVAPQASSDTSVMESIEIAPAATAPVQTFPVSETNDATTPIETTTAGATQTPVQPAE